MENATAKGEINDDMAEKFANERSKNNTLISENDKLKKELNKQNETIKALTLENSKIKNELNETIKALTNEKKNITIERDNLQRELNKQIESTKALTLERKNITIERDNLQNKIETLTKKNEELSKANRDLRNALRTNQADWDVIKLKKRFMLSLLLTLLSLHTDPHRSLFCIVPLIPKDINFGSKTGRKDVLETVL